ncbi:hypothetical protein [Nesterenkonia sp.]|uniref:TrmB family transcriptional regulator n=1 Tax=Nesterenkonia sp. TaxID=704201 RepID=UPI002615CD76|nr:hypothetical protein [Nesterenkonia sp.]
MEPSDLQSLGLSQSAARAYLQLLQAGKHRAELPAQLAEELQRHGLLGDLDGHGRAPVNDPRGVLRARARHHRQQADAVMHLEHQLGSIWERPGAAGTEIVEVIHGRAAVRQVADASQRAVVAEVRSLDRGPYSPSTAGQMCSVQQEMLPRGIRYRTVYAEDAVADPVIRQAVNDSVALGEEARVHASVPMRLRLMDDSLGLIVLIEGEQVTGMLVHPSPMLDALTELFDSIWSASVPLVVSAEDFDAGADGEEHRHLLALMPPASPMNRWRGSWESPAGRSRAGCRRCWSGQAAAPAFSSAFKPHDAAGWCDRTPGGEVSISAPPLLR